MTLSIFTVGTVRSQSNIFGCSLEKHLQSSKREIALVIEECARFLFRHGMDVEVLAFLRILQRLSKMSYYAKKWNYTSATWDLFRCIRVCSGLLVKQLRFES